MENKLPLIVLSKNSWHFKLNRYVFGTKIINTTMNNLCPYFWLMIAAMLLVPFVGILDIFINRPINFVIDQVSKHMDKTIKNWSDNLTEEEAASIWWYGDGYLNYSNFYSIPKYIQRLDDDESYSLLKRWAMKKLNIDITTKEGQDAWKEYVRKKDADITARREAQSKRNDELYKLQLKRELKARQREEKITNFMNSIAKPFNAFFSMIRKAFTVNSAGKILKITKKVVGALITGGLVVGLFYIVQLMVYLIMLIAGIWNGAAVFEFLIQLGIGLLIVIAMVAIIYFSIVGIKKLITIYQKGDKQYYAIDALIWIAQYLIWAPAKYLIWYPIYFIFVSFFWNTLCLAIFWNSLTSFWRGLLSVTGIFGEYFGRSKGDYCPGFEWKEELTENK